MRAVHLLRKFNPDQWGGTETAIQRLLDGLREHYVTPIVYCPRLEEGVIEDPLVLPGCRVQRFNAFVPVLGISKKRRRQLISVGGNLMSFDLISSLWREEDVSIIHTHTLGRIGGIALTVAKQREIPFVVTIHGGVLDLPDEVKKSFDAPHNSGWEWGKLFGLIFQSHRLFRDADAIIGCNENEANLLRQKYPSKRVLVQAHGVPLALYGDRFAALVRTDDHWSLEEELAGRQTPTHFGLILEELGIAFIAAQSPQAKGRIERMWAVLQDRLVAELRLGDVVRLHPPVSRTVLADWYRAADVVAVPSYSESFGLVALEAQACGTPVLAARVGGLCTAVRDGVTGLLVDGHDPALWARRLGGLLDDPIRRSAMEAAAVAHAGRFSWDATVEATLEVYAAARARSARTRSEAPRRMPMPMLSGVPAGVLAVAP